MLNRLQKDNVMEIRMFCINAHSTDEDLEEMNKFLRSHRVLQVDKTFSSNGDYWSILVTYQEQGASVSGGVVDVQRRQKVDYKEILSPEAYSRFEHMRSIRGELARKEGLAAFLIFSDRELSKIAELEEVTSDALDAIQGIDGKKRQKYGKYFLTNDLGDEAGG